VELRIHGRNTYEATVSDSPQGTIASLEHAVGEFESRYAESNENLGRLKTRIEELRTQSQLPFEHREKLEAAEKRQHEIIAALDLAKNQASTQVDEQPDAETQTTGEQSIGFIPTPEPSQDAVASETVQPVQEPPKVSEAPAIPSGIQTPRGPITRSPNPTQPGFFKATAWAIAQKRNEPVNLPVPTWRARALVPLVGRRRTRPRPTSSPVRTIHALTAH
jgi:hypothetical protein